MLDIIRKVNKMKLIIIKKNTKTVKNYFSDEYNFFVKDTRVNDTDILKIKTALGGHPSVTRPRCDQH